MSEDINKEIIVELRKIRTIIRWMCWLFVVFIIVCAVPPAEHLYQQARRQEPVSWQQVKAAVDQGDCQKALSMAQSLIARQPDYAYGRASLGYVYLAMGDLTNAEVQYTRAYELFPDEGSLQALNVIKNRMAAGTNSH
jgi:cytochrome c-type biogenesis protein CcmH/NrfG